MADTAAAYERTKRAFVGLCQKLQLKDIPCTDSKQLVRDFDQLCADDRLRYLGVKEDKLYLVTYPLMIRADVSMYGPVDYVITINPALKDADQFVLCESTDGSRKALQGGNYAHHPHVYMTGVPCWGPNKSQLERYRADGRLGKISILALEFLEVAGSSAYIQASEWPAMNKEEVQQCLKLRRPGMK